MKMNMKIKNILVILFGVFCVSFMMTPSSVLSQTLNEDEMRVLRDQLEKGKTGDDGIEKATPFIFDKDVLEKENEEDPFGEIRKSRENEFKITRPTNFDQGPIRRNLSSDLKPFGYDLFSKATITFAPATDIPIPNDYILGPGDNLKIFLFGNTNKDYSLQISREGEIYFSEIGIVSVAGLTFSEAKETISNRVKNQTIGSEAIITLGKLRSIRVFILGDAYQPGSYLISGLSTLSNALFISGGVNSSGSLRNIQHKRKGKVISNFDLYDLLLKGDTTNDTRLQAGDVIFIPPIVKRIGINGDVNRAALYELLEGENLETLIKYAGGLKSTADLSAVQVDTITNSGLSLRRLDLNNNNSFNLIPKNGDILHIFPVNNIYQDAILLSNYLRKPGFVAWSQDTRIGDLINPSKDLLNDTDRKYILVKRLDKQTGYISFEQINLEKVIADEKSSQNIRLNKNDELFFFKKLEKKTSDKKIIEALQVAEKGLNPDLDGIEDSAFDEAVIAAKGKGDKTFIYDGTEYNVEDYDGDIEKGAINPDYSYLSRAEITKEMVALLNNQSSPGDPSKFINILGARYPGKYPLTNNMTVLDAIFASGGLEENAFLKEAEYFEANFQKNNEYSFDRRMLVLENSDDLDLRIMPGSTISFKSAPKITRVVKLEGEVIFPGEYLLTKGETLSDLITRAGGLTSNAYTEGAFFTRESLIKADIKRIEQARRTFEQQLLYSTMGAGELGQLTGDIDTALQFVNFDIDEDILGRLVLDLESILNDGKGDIVLEEGDRLRIPSKPNSISVIGEVNVPATHIFREGKDLDFYLSLSGNINDFANEDGIYVVSANGAIQSTQVNGFFRGNVNSLKAGDTIVVPFKVNSFSTIQAVNDATAIIYQLAVATAAVSSF